MNPCVKFYRNIIEWKWFHVPEMVQLMMYLVCKADHEPYYVEGNLIDRGNVCITRKDMCSDLGMSDQTYKTCMKRLINDRKIITSNELFRTQLITVLDFSRYVVEDSKQHNPTPTKDDEALRSVGKPAPPQPSPLEIEKEEPTEKKTSPVITDSLFPDEILIDESSESNTRKKKIEVDCDFVVRLFHERCPSLPKVLKLTDKRKTKVRCRFEEMKFDYEILQQVFDKCEASFFMRGDNSRGWKADFDWIFTNSQNWVKVLEGKYDNHDNQTNTYYNYGTTPNPTPQARLGATQSDRNAANSTRQKYDILNTLAKCQKDYDSGNLPTLPGAEEGL